MIEIENWMNEFTNKVRELFGQRLVCLGLQGSYGRGEATESSDIDVVVILDQVSFQDLSDYDEMLKTLPHSILICGFVAGVEELLGWEEAELFSFYYDTTPIIGDLDFLKPLIGPAEIKRAVRIGAGNLYHSCAYNYLHEKSLETIMELSKQAFFVLRAEYFTKTGSFIRSRKELYEQAAKEDQDILRLMEIEFVQHLGLKKASELLLGWSKDLLIQYARQLPKIDYRALSMEEMDMAMEMAWKVFLKFEAPEYPKAGVDSFYESIYNRTFQSQLCLYGAFHDDTLVGVIATRSEGNHIALFFVEESYQRLGIGKHLFHMVIQENQIGEITVNSSPYAVKIYERLGFKSTNSEQLVDGIRFTPMLYKGRNE